MSSCQFRLVVAMFFVFNLPTFVYGQSVFGDVEMAETASLGLKTGRFVGPSFDKQVTYEDKGNYGLIEGDILIPYSDPNPLLDPVTGHPSVGINGYRWPSRTVYYYFSGVTSETIDIVRQATKHIASRTGMRFVELASPSRYHVRITDVSGEGCNARVGYKVYQSEVALGYQTLNLARNGCQTLGIAVHELLHSMGFWHEQSREDRDDYVTVMYENVITSPIDYSFAFDQRISDGIDLGVYDYSSIMHYNAYAFSKNNEPTIVPIFAGINDTGQQKGLSDGDVEGINLIYPGALNTFPEQFSSLTLGEIDSALYGLNYGNNGNTKNLDVSFTARGQDHTVSWTAFDIDQSGDLNLYLNGTFIKALDTTGNNLSLDRVITFTRSQLNSGSNTISFRVGTNPSDDTWGISNLLVTSENAGWLPVIYSLLLDDEVPLGDDE